MKLILSGLPPGCTVIPISYGRIPPPFPFPD